MNPKIRSILLLSLIIFVGITSSSCRRCVSGARPNSLNCSGGEWMERAREESCYSVGNGSHCPGKGDYGTQDWTERPAGPNRP